MAEQIVDIISKIGVDVQPFLSELDKVKAKYQQSNKELEDTTKLLEKLVQKEAQLTQARAAANNPTVVAQYNKKIDETRKSIELAEKAQKSLTAETKRYQRELETTAAKTKKAFDNTQTNAIGKSLLGVAAGFGIVTGITALASAVKSVAEESFNLAAKAEGIETAFHRIGGEQTLEKLRVATRGATSDLELMQAALRAQNFNISTDLLAKGLELAGKVARTTGQDVTYLTNSFVDGLGRKSIRILDNLQISQVALQAEIKKTGDFNVAVGNIIDQKLKETGAVLDTTADKVGRLSSFWDNLKLTIGEFLVNGASNLIDFFEVLSGKISFADAGLRAALEMRQKELEKSNGNILDQARESEHARLTLLLESSRRIVALNKEIGTQVTDQEIKNLEERHANAQGFDRIEIAKELERLDRVKHRTKEEFAGLQQIYANEQQLNALLRNLNKKRTEDFDEEGAKRAKKEHEFLVNLELELRRVQSILRSQVVQNSDVNELEKINAKFTELAVQNTIEFEKRRDNIIKEVTSEKNRNEALITLKHIQNVELAKLDDQRLSDIKAFRRKQQLAEIEGSRSVAELDLKIAQAQTTFTLNDSEERIAILVDYTAKRMQLMQEEGRDEIEILKFVKDQALAVEQIRKDQLLAVQRQANAEFEEEERFHLAILEYKKRIHQSQITTATIKFEEKRLDQMKADYDEQVKLTGQQDNERLLAIEKQEHDIALLKKKQRKQERQEIIDQTVFIIDNINTVTQALVNSVDKVLAAKIRETDTLIGLQQRRVDETAQIADKGNAALLELEKKRLDDLTKEKEKFVRNQQALASIELIANTAVAVSKAAAEGGAGAAFTIAAALIALVAGLAEARSIAGQAAFFKGGESDGYTGDGSIHAESSNLGRKPYIYHKKEFIFNNEKTSKYIDVFRKVHSGQLDLNQMKFEADMYRALREKNIDVYRDVNYRSAESGSMADLSRLERKFDSVVDAIKAQPGMSVHFDEHGIAIITNRFYKNRERIDAIT